MREVYAIELSVTTCHKENILKLEEVRNIAKLHSIKPNHLSKADLIRSIQRGEGNFDCFATASSGECDQVNCLWRSDCFDAAQKGELS